MRFVWVPSASAFVFEAEGETQALVTWTFDEEESNWRTRRGREGAYEVYELFLLLSLFLSLSVTILSKFLRLNLGSFFA